jgi:predicted AlkP superfamily phosphohydrolase/phosphomutase
MDPMMKRGELPNFAALVERGVRGELLALPPLSSPVAWTTMATGRFGRAHHVLDHTYPYVEGPKNPIDSTMRRAPAIWNIASAYDRSVGVVGYFASHPPDVVNGFMVSDRAAQGAAGAAYPADVLAPLQAALDALEQPEERARLYSRYLPWEYDRRAVNRPGDPYHRVSNVVRGRIDRQIIVDEYVRRASLGLMSPDLDLFITYLRMVDHACHASWIYFDDSTFEDKPDPVDKELLGDLIPAAYRYMDAYLGEIVERAGENANILVVSDHGAGPATGMWTIGRDELAELTGNHRMNGIFLAAGPDFATGEVEGLTLMDVAPIALAALELPISRELVAEVARRVFRDGYFDDAPVRRTDRYDPRMRQVATAQELTVEQQEEALEALKALGYVGGAETVAGSEGDVEDIDFWQIESRLRRNVLLGEILYYLIEDDDAALARLMNEIAENDPELAKGAPRLVENQLRMAEDSMKEPIVPEERFTRFREEYGQ